MDKTEIELKKAKALSKYILLSIDNEKQQEIVLSYLKEKSKDLPDKKIVDYIQREIRKRTKDYYKLVESFINDIYNSKKTKNNLEILTKIPSEIKELFANQRTDYEKAIDLIKWS